MPNEVENIQNDQTCLKLQSEEVSDGFLVQGIGVVNLDHHPTCGISGEQLVCFISLS